MYTSNSLFCLFGSSSLTYIATTTHARLINVGSVSDEKWTCSIESTRQKALRLEKERKEQQQALEEVERQKVGLYSCLDILSLLFDLKLKIDGGLIENIVTVVDYFLFNNVLGRGRIGTRVQGQSGRGEPRWVG